MARLIACPACDNHNFANEAQCRSCGQSLRATDGSLNRTATAVLLGLTLTAGTAVAACGDSGTSGSGGGGGASSNVGGGGFQAISAYGVGPGGGFDVGSAGGAGGGVGGSGGAGGQ